MKDMIFPKLEASRKELLDLGMRNTLLNYKVPKARGLHIVQEQSSSIYNILVKQNKSMTFLGRPGKDDSDELFELPPLSDNELQDAYNDTRLQTNESEQKLQTKILNTYYAAKTSIEEQGVNTLFLSLGMLQWFEKGNNEEVRLAPLILVPVSLERSSASERFRLRYTGGEVGANLSLQAKMMADFNLTLPNLSGEDDLSVVDYFKEIQEQIKHFENWKVDHDTIELGFFSFGKFMIYHDLDSTIWPDHKKPFDHPILQSIFGDGFTEPQPTVGEDHRLDEETDADQLLQVVDADSSQVIAMLAVHEGRNMVIQGPPGTGKSQTITNIIANAVGNGKKVLFVAEKMAALEVVKRRLDSINLGEACLELHSHKANKRDLHTELKRILELGRPTVAHLEEEVRLLNPMVKELNAYSSEVNSMIGQSGLSAHEVMGHLLKINNENKDYRFPKIIADDLSSWDFRKIHDYEMIAEQIQVRLHKIGQPEKLIFYGTDLTVFLPKDEEVAKDLILKLIHTSEKLISVSKTLSEFLEFQTPVDLPEAKKLLMVAELVIKNPGVSSMAIDDSAWLNNQADINDILEIGGRLKELHNTYDSVFIPEAWEQDVLEIRQHLLANGKKWYKFLIGDYKSSVKKLAALLNTVVPDDLQTKLDFVNALMEGRRLASSLAAYDALANRIFNNQWQRQKSDWTALKEKSTYLQSVHIAIQQAQVPKEILQVLEKNKSIDSIIEYTNLLRYQIDEQSKTFIALFNHLHFAGNGIENFKLSVQVTVLHKWLEQLPEIHKVISWNVLKEDVEKQGAGFLIKAVNSWSDASLYLKTALQKTWYDHLLEQAMLNSAVLRKFERSTHEEIISKFKRTDVLQQYYNRAKVALKHWEGVPKQEGGGQINILKSEFNRKVRHMPIRKLIQEAGLAIQAIKPVIMMSPMSIANFLSPDSIDFDLVIFDEASQVRPVDALGAILRGKQIVVVGDTKQMPPSSFFDKLNTDTEDEENVTADMQSILGMCDAQGAPQRMLRWHYRSRHESLISLSNQEFYENKLIIFPSPGSKNRMGLSFNHLPDTFYDKGKTRTNPKEAEKVADAVIQHALKTPKLSLGVVAFSTAQMQAIQNEIELRRRKNPEVESYFRAHTDEPFFVKNLENVQGDERDVIFISIGYGRTEDGKVPMSFGPLNNEGGERRLNVLITRAKSRCEVFTNITAADMTLGSNAKFGVRALKSFLYFAQYGKFESDKDELPYQPQPFEEVVAEALRNEGYIVREKVGSAGFYIDLAIVDADNPGRYLLGVICDGRSYQAAKSTRDRDRLRNTVLEGMGWNLLNVWSLDWFRNPSGEIKLLIETIEKARIQAEHNDIIEEELMEDLKNLIREAPLEEHPVVYPMYEQKILSSEIANQELHLHPLGKLSAWIQEVVITESPIHFEEMARRIADANGISKIGSRVRASITSATEYAVDSGLIIKKGDFLWHPQNELSTIRDRSLLSPNSKKIMLIAPEEINLAIIKVVSDSVAIQPDNAAPLISKLLGYSRVTEDIKKCILETIEYSKVIGSIYQDGVFLKITEK
ncbi:Part of AAA domain-containing protein [Chryseobacterium polytrichastri]|uniref:Part of AAA domain-containing protein n=2 Tax=Chryseobacterium polytrichastri TaxID=1302687 RepID=A0A1M6VN01_9FLAO|nr:Part of AAA domain-containing protein [Chryseobacterium polytrichastri]